MIQFSSYLTLNPTHMSNLQYSILAGLLIFTASSVADDGTFLYPDPQATPIYSDVDVLNASWQTSFDDAQLILFCTGLTHDYYNNCMF